jgi:hypothetical protein
MDEYRCFLLDGADHVVAGDSIRAASVDEAWRKVAAAGKGHAATARSVELWRQDRCLGRRLSGPPARPVVLVTF